MLMLNHQPIITKYLTLGMVSSNMYFIASNQALTIKL